MWKVTASLKCIENVTISHYKLNQRLTEQAGLFIMITKHLPYVRACVRPSIHSSCFCINLNISFIYEDIFTKFAGNVYGYENLSLKNFSLILKSKMAAMGNCLKIVKVL